MTVCVVMSTQKGAKGYVCVCVCETVEGSNNKSFDTMVHPINKSKQIQSQINKGRASIPCSPAAAVRIAK
jgi:hypothetical protein